MEKTYDIVVNTSTNWTLAILVAVVLLVLLPVFAYAIWGRKGIRATVGHVCCYIAVGAAVSLLVAGVAYLLPGKVLHTQDAVEQALQADGYTTGMVGSATDLSQGDPTEILLKKGGKEDVCQAEVAWVGESSFRGGWGWSNRQEPGKLIVKC